MRIRKKKSNAEFMTSKNTKNVMHQRQIERMVSMTQLALSTDLQVITAEINSYKQIAGQAIFEIGRRLKHVREEKIAEKRGGWMVWLREIELDDSQARKFIKVFDELGNRGTYTALGLRALYEIASLPPEEREKPQVIPSSGETKVPAEMTTRELQEVKKALREAEKSAAEAEKRAKQAEAERTLAIQQHTEQQGKLLVQIKELEQRNGRSKEDEEQLGRLIKENAELTASMRMLQQEMTERNLTMEKQLHDLRKLQEALNKTRGVIESSFGTALAHLAGIPDNKEAIETVRIFWRHITESLERNRKEFSQIIGIELEVLEGGAVRNRNARSPIVIDAETGE
ncbi:hypothetical protein AK95_14645 [Paenibacillus sp. LC231]|uniref:hypothetical protein n=1 Tax=Paenibacillus sp. LC231 TaxID=1120679 RepID=UPI0008DDB02A|nr:hypothetical protein [Paenibacillus sp. LC231]OIB04851.1 hypothetical protein AK95_14645 [Paenibacillus sp. LC231]